MTPLPKKPSEILKEVLFRECSGAVCCHEVEEAHFLNYKEELSYALISLLLEVKERFQEPTVSPTNVFDDGYASSIRNVRQVLDQLIAEVKQS